MKNAKEYEKKIKKLLSEAVKTRPAAVATEDQIRLMIESILQADAPRKQAESACNAMLKEFVDYNEMRVAPIKEIAECAGKSFPFSREKAEAIIAALNNVFDRNGSFGLEFLANIPKRDLRRHMVELGMSPYAASCLAIHVFETHAIPVDHSLVISLEAEGYIHPGSDVADVQGFLERIVAQKDDQAVHDFLVKYVEKNAKIVAKRFKSEPELFAAAQTQNKPVAPAITPPAPLLGGMGELPVALDDEEAMPIVLEEEGDESISSEPKIHLPIKPLIKKPDRTKFMSKIRPSRK